MMVVYIIIGLGVALLIIAFIRHQRQLRLRAHLVQEAIRNHDFSLRLPTNSLLSGERALQETLNQLSETFRQQVNENEVEAWERLTRVLTHEILNSIASVSSISQSLLRRDDIKGTPLEEGISVIHNTSQRLNTYVDSFRKLSQLQQPVFDTILLNDIIKNTQSLYPTLDWHIHIPREYTIRGDRNMLQQVFVNLVKNAIEAKAHTIGIEVEEEKNMLAVYVSNDGNPVPEEVRQSIFVPFFTTKLTGSGIGLSLCRSMMIQQNGGIELLEHARNSFHTTFKILLYRSVSNS